MLQTIRVLVSYCVPGRFSGGNWDAPDDTLSHSPSDLPSPVLSQTNKLAGVLSSSGVRVTNLDRYAINFCGVEVNRDSFHTRP